MRRETRLTREGDRCGTERELASVAQQEALDHFVLSWIEGLTLGAKVQEVAVLEAGTPSRAATLPLRKHLLTSRLDLDRRNHWRR